jgi:hypothetical protein
VLLGRGDEILAFANSGLGATTSALPLLVVAAPGGLQLARVDQLGLFADPDQVLAEPV